MSRLDCSYYSVRCGFGFCTFLPKCLFLFLMLSASVLCLGFVKSVFEFDLCLIHTSRVVSFSCWSPGLDFILTASQPVSWAVNVGELDAIELQSVLVSNGIQVPVLHI